MTSVCALVLGALCQHLAVEPPGVEQGQTVEVRAVDASGTAVAGVAVTLEGPDDSRRVLGRTAEDGRLRFEPEAAGPHVLRARVEGVELLTPYFVAERRKRWLYALACLPLGLVLLWTGARRYRRAGEPVTRASRRSPSPP